MLSFPTNAVVTPPGPLTSFGANVGPLSFFQAAKGAAAYERSEDPVYVLENNVPIDTEYYLTNQLSKPLSRLFEVITCTFVATVEYFPLATFVR